MFRANCKDNHTTQLNKIRSMPEHMCIETIALTKIDFLGQIIQYNICFSYKIILTLLYNKHTHIYIYIYVYPFM